MITGFFIFLQWLVTAFLLLLLACPIAIFYWLWTMARRRRCRSRLVERGWPRIWITPDLLAYPDAAWQRLPPYEEVVVTPSTPAANSPRKALRSTLHMLSPDGWQWRRM